MRQKRSGFDALLYLPWWVALSLGAIGYLGVRYVAPVVLSTSPILASAATAVKPLAIIIFLTCAAAALFSAIRSGWVSRTFDRQSSIQDLGNLTWQQFEVMLAEAFRRRGYRVVENGGRGADGGVDLVASKDGKRYLVQCKQWRTMKVGVRPVRELQGVVATEGAAGGIFVTLGRFTDEAERFAARCGMELIDAASLARMIGQGQGGDFSDVSRATAAMASPLEGNASPSCPKCGASMARRIARRGSNAGNAFWGCSGFPACNGTRAIQPL